MNLPASMHRRQFLQTTATAALATSAAFSQEKSPPSIRIACCAAGFHGFAAGSNPLDAIRRIGALGFDGIELIILSPADLATIWSGHSLDAIEAALSSVGLTICRFGVFGPCMRNIASDANAARDADFATFEKACAVAKRLGASQMGYVGWSVPGTSPFTYQLAKEAAPGTKIVQRIPDNFD